MESAMGTCVLETRVLGVYIGSDPLNIGGYKISKAWNTNLRIRKSCCFTGPGFRYFYTGCKLRGVCKGLMAWIER
jgi:hypothetical protein